MVNSLGGISNINNSNNSMSMGNKGVNVSKKLKPLKPKGRLIGKTEWVGPKCFVNDIKAIGKGLQGKANDYELGRQNDLALAAGSYGLAAYLSTKTPTTKGKIMEFVGASVFLGMMKLWPKIAFQYPLEAKYGVNVHQKYEDSYGRIKDFYQDSQYTPWDLYTQKDYDKMAKKMGIPANAKNKNEKVQEKAHDIALQANTWWMLTAGLASGIGTPLICNQLEKPVSALSQMIDFKWAKSQLDKVDIKQVTKDYKVQNKKALKQVDKILSENKSLSEEVLDKLANIMILVDKNEKADTTAINAMKKQINALIPKKTFNAENVLDYFKNPKNSSNFNSQNLKTLIDEYKIDLSKIDTSKIKTSDEFLDALKGAAKDKNLAINGKNIGDVFEPILKQLESMFNTSSIDDNFKNNIHDLFNRMDAVRTNQKHLFNFFQKTVGDVEGSIIANSANKFSDTFIKALGIKGKDLVEASKNDDSARKIITKYMQDVSKDEKKYKKVIESLANIQNNILETLNDDLLKNYIEKVEQGTKVFGKDGKFSIIEQHFLGTSKSLDGSQLKIYQSKLASRIEGIQAYFAKPIVALDVFRRIETGDLKKQWEVIQNADSNLKNVKFDDVQKIITEMFTKNDKISSYSTKHGIDKNSLYQAIYKLVYPTGALDNKSIEQTLSEVANYGGKSNKDFYKKMLSKDTIAGLGGENSKVLQVLSDISTKINYWLGCGKDLLNPNCITQKDFGNKINGNIFSKEDLASQSLERLLSDTAKRKRNTKIWSGVMIGCSIATIATTLVALLTIGKNSKSDSKKIHNKQQNSKGVVA